MAKIIKWYYNLPKQVRNSMIISATIVGAISTVLSILGISLGDIEKLSIWVRIVIVIAVYSLLTAGIYFAN